MAIQDFVTGQVLTSTQMDNLQANDYNQTVSAKVASYVLVAADKGTRVTMSNAGATTITVNTSLFAAGDTLFITNIGAGACTITAGTATVSTASSLVLAQYDSGRLYFTSTGVAIWEKYQGAAAASTSGPAFSAYRSGTAQSFSNSTFTKVQFNSENFDTDNCYDSATNYRFTPTTAGKYQINSTIFYATNASGSAIMAIYKNGTVYKRLYDMNAQPANLSWSASTLIDMNGTTDYLEMYVYYVASVPTIDTNYTTFSGAWIRT